MHERTLSSENLIRFLLIIIYYRIFQTDSTALQVGDNHGIINPLCDKDVVGDYCQNDGVCYIGDNADGQCPQDFNFSSGSCYHLASDSDTWCGARQQCFNLQPLAEILRLNSAFDELKFIESLVSNKLLNDTVWISDHGSIGNESCTESDLCPLFRIQNSSFDKVDCNQHHPFICQVEPQDEQPMCFCQSPYSGITCNELENQRHDVTNPKKGIFACHNHSQVLMVEFAATLETSSKPECKKRSPLPLVTSRCQGLSECNFLEVLGSCFPDTVLKLGCYWGTELYCPLPQSRLILNQTMFRCFFVVFEKQEWTALSKTCNILGGEIAPSSVLHDDFVKTEIKTFLSPWSENKSLEYFWFINNVKNCDIVLWREEEPIILPDNCDGKYKGVCSLPPQVKPLQPTSTTLCPTSVSVTESSAAPSEKTSYSSTVSTTNSDSDTSSVTSYSTVDSSTVSATNSDSDTSSVTSDSTVDSSTISATNSDSDTSSVTSDWTVDSSTVSATNSDSDTSSVTSDSTFVSSTVSATNSDSDTSSVTSDSTVDALTVSATNSDSDTSSVTSDSTVDSSTVSATNSDSDTSSVTSDSTVDSSTISATNSDSDTSSVTNDSTVDSSTISATNSDSDTSSVTNDSTVDSSTVSATNSDSDTSSVTSDSTVDSSTVSATNSDSDTSSVTSDSTFVSSTVSVTSSDSDTSSVTSDSSSDANSNLMTNSDFNSTIISTTSDATHTSTIDYIITSDIPDISNPIVVIKNQCIRISCVEMYLCILEKLTNLTASVKHLTRVPEGVWSSVDLIYPLRRHLPSFERNHTVTVFNYTMEIVNNLLNVNHLPSWSNDTEKKIDSISRLIQLVEDVGKRAASYLQSGTSVYYSNKNIDIKIFKTDKRDDVVFVMNSLESSSISLESSLPAEGAVGVLHLWKTLENFLPLEKGHRFTYSQQLGSKPLGLSIQTNSSDWSTNVIITMETITEITPNNESCVFFNTSKNGQSFFDVSGCSLYNSSRDFVTCYCNHLTTFAVLTNWNDVDLSDELSLELITLIGCVISIFSLIACLIAIFLIKSTGNMRNVIHANLCFCLLIGNFTLLLGHRYSMSLVSCYFVASILHFAFLSSFMWMMLEGVHIFVMIVSVFFNNNKYWIFYSAGYGIPLIIVSISLAISFSSNTSYINSETVCWLNPRNNMIWSFLGPVIFIVCGNMMILIFALYKAQTLQSTKHRQTIQKTKQVVWGMMVLTPILGITWFFGYLFFDDRTKAFAYIFSILNSLQGLFIFIFHFVVNNNMRSMVMESKYFSNTRRRLTRSSPILSTMATPTSSMKNHPARDIHFRSSAFN